MTRAVACISGSRADYHLMVPVFEALAAAPGLSATLLATCAHLHPAFRESSAQALRGFPGRVQFVDMPMDGDSGLGMAQALGRGVLNLAQALDALRPDILLLQGDRGEMLAGAMAAAHMNIPVVHMSGGDRTGSIDNAIRNAITAFAHVHLTTCADSTAALLAMGEDPGRVFQVGEPALDRILSMTFTPRAELCARLNLDPAKPILAATLHPVTTEQDRAGEQMRALLEALDALGEQTVLTEPNTDAGGQAMRETLRAHGERPWLRVEQSLGFTAYASLLREAAAMVGNSSSGILEAPSFGLPVVNVGQRQHGRLRAGNVLDVDNDAPAILAGLRRALHDEDFRAACRACVNPYGNGTASAATADILARLDLGPALLDKWRALNAPLLHGHGL